MANFASLTAQLNLNIQNFSQNMQKASSIATKFAANMNGQINAGMVDPVKKSKFEFKDVSRIVQGILISKAFYSGLNAIRQAKDAVWEFSKELEYAKMIYTNLFGDSDLALEFINVLKDFAAVTPFSFKQSEAAAKRLLAYGLEYQNIMYVMQGVLAAATVQGTDAVIEPISRAFGQIYTKGRLMNEEMRQLAEAGIPVYEILQEKLGLTAEQLRNLGREAVPASDAINALIEGINERFGTTLQYASMTTTGIISNLKDNAVMLFSGIFTPLAENVRLALGGLGELMNELRSLEELGGVGAVFERLVPPSLQQSVKSLVANLQLLWQVVKSALGTVFDTLKIALVALLQVFNALAPAIITVLGVLAGFAKALVDNERLMKFLTVTILGAASAWLIYKLQVITAAATSALVKGMTIVIQGLTTALTFLAAHPVWAMLAVGVGIFVALSGASEKFRNSIGAAYKDLFAMGGINTEKMLLPESKDRASDLSKFNKALSGTKSSMDDLADSTGAAAKAAKGLLGFDEVFALKTPDEGNAADDYASMLDGLSGLDFSGLSLDMPDVSEIATNFVDNLVSALGGQNKILAAGIGTLLGSAIGAVIGGPIGMKLGGVIGSIAGWFWPTLAEALGLTDVGTVALPIATGIGLALGFILGGPMGAAVGAGIGALVGWLIDSITVGLTNGDWSKIAKPIGIGLGAAIGFVIGGPIGAVVGGAIGALVGWIVELLVKNWDTVTKWFDKIGQWFITAGATIGQFFVGIGDGISVFNSSVATWLDGVWTVISTWFTGVLTGFTNFFTTLFDMIVAVGQFLFQPIIDRTKFLWDIISPFLQDVWNGIYTLFSDIFGALVTVAQDIGTVVSTVSDRVWQTLSGLWGLIRDLFITYGGILLDTVVKTFKSIFEAVTTAMKNIWTGISNQLQLVVTLVTDRFQAIWNVVSEKLQAVWSVVSEKFQAIWNVVSEKLTAVWNTVSEIFGNIYEGIKTSISDMYDSVKGGIGNIYTAFKDWISDMWTDVFDKFFGWIDDAISKLREFFGLDAKAQSTDTSYTSSTGITGKVSAGHALGGVFNREHVARFAENNKPEAVIPLDNATAMQPFVDAVSNGLTSALAPILVNMSNSNQSQLQPLLVGTLIADDRSLKELERKMQLVRTAENQRRGLNG